MSTHLLKTYTQKKFQLGQIADAFTNIYKYFNHKSDKCGAVFSFEENHSDHRDILLKDLINIVEINKNPSLLATDLPHGIGSIYLYSHKNYLVGNFDFKNPNDLKESVNILEKNLSLEILEASENENDYANLEGRVTKIEQIIDNQSTKLTCFLSYRLILYLSFCNFTLLPI